jgi:hypothetical protein
MSVKPPQNPSKRPSECIATGAAKVSRLGSGRWWRGEPRAVIAVPVGEPLRCCRFCRWSSDEVNWSDRLAAWCCFECYEAPRWRRILRMLRAHWRVTNLRPNGPQGSRSGRCPGD